MANIVKRYNRAPCYDENHWVTPHYHEVDGPDMLRRLEGGSLESVSGGLVLGENDE